MGNRPRRVALAALFVAVAACGGGHRDELHCPEGSYAGNYGYTDDTCLPGSPYDFGDGTECDWHGEPAVARLCVIHYPGNFEYDPSDDVRGTCPADGHCANDAACEEVHFCRRGPVGRALARTMVAAWHVHGDAPFLAPIGLLTIAACLARALSRRRRNAPSAVSGPTKDEAARSSRAPAEPLVIRGAVSETRHRSGARWRSIAWALATCAPLALCATSELGDDYVPSGAIMDLVALLFSIAAIGVVGVPTTLAIAWLAARRRSLGQGTARFDGTTLQIEAGATRRALPPSALACGVVAANGRLLLDTLDGHTLVLETDLESATRMLDALELDVSRRGFRLRWHRRLPRAITFGVALIAFVSGAFVAVGMLHGSEWSFYVGFAVALLWAGGLSRWVSARELRVGLDEIAFVALDRTRTFRFADVARLDSMLDLVLTMRDGTETRLMVGADDDMRVACHERAWMARAAAKRLSAEGRADLEKLRRGDRTVAAWREALSGLAIEKAGFRDAAGLGRRDLLAVLADPGADSEIRVAAAIAVAASGADDDRRRITLAARCTSSAPLRAALDETLKAAPDEGILLAGAAVD